MPPWPCGLQEGSSISEADWEAHPPGADQALSRQHPGRAKPSATAERPEALSPGGLCPLPITGHLCSPLSLPAEWGHRPLQ